MTDSATSPDVEAPDVELETKGVAPADQDAGEGAVSDTDHDDDGLDTEQTADAGVGEDDGLDDFELDGKTYRVPKTLIEGQLRNEDYTRKTQEVARKAEMAEARERAAQAQEEFLATHAEAVKANLADVARLTSLEADIAKYDGYDQWEQLKVADPDAYREHRDRHRDLKEERRDLQAKVKTAEETIGLEARKRAETARQSALQEAAVVLKRDIKDWGPKLVEEIAGFAEQKFGYSRAEFLDIATDARNVKALHLALIGEKTLNRERAAKKAEQSQRTKPANEVGAGAPNARRPSDASGDRLSTDEWRRRRDAEVAAKRGA